MVMKAWSGGGGGGAAAGITIGTSVITGGIDTRVLFDDAGKVGESAGFVYIKATGQATATLLVASTSLTAPLLQAGATGGTIALSTTAGQGPTIAVGTATTDVAALSLTRTNNNAAVATGVLWAFTDTSSAATFKPFQILGGSTATNNLFNISKAGIITFGSDASTQAILTAGPFNGEMQLGSNVYSDQNNNRLQLRAAGAFSWSSTSTVTGTADTSISRGGVNQTVFAGATTGGGTATSRAEINKSVTAIADSVATVVATFTIPNGNHSAGGQIILKGAAGAGGAVGADEFSALIAYDYVITRTTGANAVVTLSAALLTAISASVAGGATPTISAAFSAVSGAVGATNTAALNVTIHAITGSSTNHTCFPYIVLINDNASGVTVA